MREIDLCKKAVYFMPYKPPALTKVGCMGMVCKVAKERDRRMSRFMGIIAPIYFFLGVFLLLLSLILIDSFGKSRDIGRTMGGNFFW